MRELLVEKSKLLAENTAYIRKTYKFDYAVLQNVAAMTLTLKGIKAEDSDYVKAVNAIKQRTGLLSDLNNYFRLPLAAKMLYGNEPLKYLENVIDTSKLTNAGIFASVPKATEAMIISEYIESRNIPGIVERANELYLGMKNNSVLRTDSRMLNDAAFLTIASADSGATLENLERIYAGLVNYFPRKKNALEIASIILLSDAFSDVGCEQVISVCKELDKAGWGLGKGREAIVAGAFAGLNFQPWDVVHDVIEVEQFLSGVKGYGNLVFGSKRRRSFATLLVLSAYEEEQNLSVAISEDISDKLSLKINAALYAMINYAVETAISTTAACCC